MSGKVVLTRIPLRRLDKCDLGKHKPRTDRYPTFLDRRAHFLGDQESMTAAEVWAGQTIYSAICSSAYEASGQSIVVDYAFASNGTEALLVGLDLSHNVVFEFKYPTTGCNARPIPLDDLKVNE